MNETKTRPSIASLLSRQIVVFDGGMGTTLYGHGIPYSQCFDELNLVRPEVVLEIHAGYVEAGAQVLETNTFGANRYRLAEHNLDQQLVAINRAGVLLARQAAGDRALVAGSIGPLGKHLIPIGNLEPADAALAYREQAEALVAAGADFLILETITHLEEMVVAVRAVNDLGVPVVALMTFTEEAKSLVGNKPEEVAQALSDMNVAALGANCSVGPQGILEVLERMVPHARVPVVAMPNAGLPRLVNGRYIYLSSPEYMGDFARKAVNLGVAAVGGCCGTTAEHVRALAQAVASSKPKPPGTAIVLEVRESHTPVSTPALPSRAPGFYELLGKRFAISVEIDPPRGVQVERYVKSAVYLKSKGADAINVADSPLARPRMSPSAFCHILQRDAGVETILHISCRDRNLLATQSEIMGAHALGIRNIIAVTGDPVQVGGYLKASDVFDLDSVSLTRLIATFNDGTDFSGKATDEPTQFRICVAANPTAVDIGAEIEKLHRKIDAGAHFIFTQPVYGARDLESFLELFGRLPIPLCVGILPLRNARHAEFLHNEIPGMSVPEEIRKRMHAAGEHGQEEGIAIAIETLNACRPICQGAYLMPPFNRFEMAGQVLEGVGAR
ncbi:MAG TPA: bifunctional homocysteine S-methyltransferase/methylenetetrahydrofolate reductase [Dongiaceae bacterium]|jgi:homocysteine S-methyltransferase|nr:bifunctional homocysteine S-methyltransferase/methylenetetrahydrofolate reductase [Dongiaceae bacterium]